MPHEYTRNLRGNALAKEVINFNGHQAPLTFIAFHPAWFFCILFGSLGVVFGLLKYVFFAGLLGLIFEMVLFTFYFAKTRKLGSYPGLINWYDIAIRRTFMALGRRASELSLP